MDIVLITYRDELRFAHADCAAKKRIPVDRYMRKDLKIANSLKCAVCNAEFLPHGRPGSPQLRLIRGKKKG